MSRTLREPLPAEHAPQNVLGDSGEIARFYDRCSDLMRELLDGLAALPGRPRPFPEIEDAIGWPRRRIASVLGGVFRLRQREFAGRRPYRFQAAGQSASGRWEMWMDSGQARAVRAAQRTAATAREGSARSGVLIGEVPTIDEEAERGQSNGCADDGRGPCGGGVR